MGTYWENRAMESVGRWENAVNQKAREMAQAFEEAKKAIEGEIYSFYGRYAKNNQITMEEAKKALSRKELAEFKGTLAEYEQLARNSIGTFNLEVENLSMKARLTRLDALLLQIDGELQRLYQQLREGIAETTENVLIEEYYHTKYNLSVEAKRMLAFSKIPKSFIEQVLAYPIAGADISARLWKQGADTSFYIRQTLNRMFIEGRPPQDFAEGLAKKIGAVQIDKEGKVTGGGKKYEAYRLLYNEAGYAARQAELRSYEEAEVPYYDITATLDTKTSPICRSLDGCRFSVTSGGRVPEEYKKTGSQYRQAAYSTDRVIVGVNYPPFHVGCRTTTTPAYETTDIASMSRAASDANGKYITVPASMTYEEWYETYIENPSKNAIIKVEKEQPKLTNDEEWALNEYISSGSYKVNPYLRAGFPLTEEQQHLIRNLDSALEKMPVYQGKTNRSLVMDKESLLQFVEEHNVGTEITYREYISSSTDEHYHTAPTVTLHILSKSGRDIRQYNQKEKEILFKRNSQFKVLNMKKQDGVYVFELEEK